MRDRFLVVIGCQREKLELIDKKIKQSILDFINAESHNYTGVISIIRKRMNGDRNFQRSGDQVASDTNTYLDYESSNVIEVPGYDVDCNAFRRDAEYHLIGISTSASVLTIAMSMYSVGLDVKVIEEYCEDRKGKKLEEHAFEIMRAYMPGCLISRKELR